MLENNYRPLMDLLYKSYVYLYLRFFFSLEFFSSPFEINTKETKKVTYASTILHVGEISPKKTATYLKCANLP